MKKIIYFLLVILLTYSAFSQDKIDPPNLFAPGLPLYQFKTDHFKSDTSFFVRGWNWGSPAQDEPHFKSGVHL
jgi:hypothetical protein